MKRIVNFRWNRASEVIGVQVSNKDSIIIESQRLIFCEVPACLQIPKIGQIAQYRWNGPRQLVA